MRIVDLTGQRFGRLVVIERDTNASPRRVRWTCRCDCGRRLSVASDKLRSNETQSCGCLKRDRWQRNMNRGRTIHGRWHTKTYKAWAHMLSRCSNPKLRGYARYGGRGIRVCDRWRSFETFLADMGERPAGLTLDRIENDGNYEPGNCRWATRKVQQNNTSRNRLLTFSGETLSVAEWSRRLRMPTTTIKGRLRLGWTVYDALSKPVRLRRR